MYGTYYASMHHTPAEGWQAGQVPVELSEWIVAWTPSQAQAWYYCGGATRMLLRLKHVVLEFEWDTVAGRASSRGTRLAGGEDFWTQKCKKWRDGGRPACRRALRYASFRVGADGECLAPGEGHRCGGMGMGPRKSALHCVPRTRACGASATSPLRASDGCARAMCTIDVDGG